MKKLLSLLLCMSLLHPTCASTEGDNPFGAKPPAIRNIRYEPLEVELVDVTEAPIAAAAPWYKSKRFWCLAGVITGTIATTAAVTYAIIKATSGEEHSSDVLASPSPSPLPSVLASITSTALASVTATASAVYASMTGNRTNTITPSWTSTETDSPSWSYSNTMTPSPSMLPSPTPSFSPDMWRHFNQAEDCAKRKVSGMLALPQSIIEFGYYPLFNVTTLEQMSTCKFSCFKNITLFWNNNNNVLPNQGDTIYAFCTNGISENFLRENVSTSAMKIALKKFYPLPNYALNGNYWSTTHGVCPPYYDVRAISDSNTSCGSSDYVFPPK